ncbi:MAG: bifunctional DNA-formamidopyrimidine glycosylase/DNA-(apurinic or apyrimidinic site) lyase [Planctomycetes bacterium]|nr:bifunctional DNA-formamidopyrimidine glycosylase/DNA-(apurinic or apyrimidinic site) lyase [Planctomycetota bacterium]
MPELPEVEAVAREVRRALRRSTIVGASVHRWDVVAGASGQIDRILLGSRIERVLRHGKQLALVGCDGNILVVQLGMTGAFGVVPASSPIATHTHITWHLDQSRDLRFVDPRRFGRVTWLGGQTALRTRWSLLGPDALDLRPGWSVAFSTSRRAIKAALLDQCAVAGVGNIYADEALALVGIRPQRRCCRLTQRELDGLGQAIGSIMRSAIACGGSTIRTYRRLGGGAGAFQDSLRVYGRSGQPCAVCSRPLRTGRVAGRATVWCESCQT